MAIRANLFIRGRNKEFPLVECEYRFSIPTDADGTVCDGVFGGQIIATMVTPPDFMDMYAWLFNQNTLLNGCVDFITNMNSNHPATHRVMFGYARAVDIYEYFNNQSKTMMTTRLTLQCREIGFYSEKSTEPCFDFRLQKFFTKSAGVMLNYEAPDPAGEAGERMMEMFK